jgi:hypothetical protein
MASLGKAGMVRLDAMRLITARRDKSRLIVAGQVGRDRPDAIWHDKARQGRLGWVGFEVAGHVAVVRAGEVRNDTSSQAQLRSGKAGRLRRVEKWQDWARPGKAGMERLVSKWLVTIQSGKAGQSWRDESSSGVVRHEKAGRGGTRKADESQLGVMCQDEIRRRRHGKQRQGPI